MVNRHVVTKQRAPSIKEMVRRTEALLEEETDPKGIKQLEGYLAYWKGRQKRRKE
ncbi:hypothetical protein LCGC14_2277210 [marine sediment metagenome]|uniref:Uncharacterized protein n=1 Tax=marine sediment metagenome TaxID=412755 RepID=A0A0F9CVA7_9ZZZZ